MNKLPSTRRIDLQPSCSKMLGGKTPHAVRNPRPREPSPCPNPAVRRTAPKTGNQNLMHPERTARYPKDSVKLRANSVKLQSQKCRPTRPRRNRMKPKPDAKTSCALSAPPAVQYSPRQLRETPKPTMSPNPPPPEPLETNTRRKDPLHPERTSRCPKGSVQLRANSVKLQSQQCRPTRPRRSLVKPKPDAKTPCTLSTPPAVRAAP